jgi:hypothetical protein
MINRGTIFAGVSLTLISAAAIAFAAGQPFPGQQL